MNPAAILALIGDLYGQLSQLQHQVDELTKDNAELRNTPGDPVPESLHNGILDCAMNGGG